MLPLSMRNIENVHLQTGSILWLFGFIVFLLSEIGAVLVVRDQVFGDFFLLCTVKNHPTRY